MIVVSTSTRILQRVPELTGGVIEVAEVGVCRDACMNHRTRLLSNASKKVDYKQWLKTIVEAHRAFGGRPFTTEFADVVVFSRLYDQLDLLIKKSHWTAEADLKYQNQSGKRRQCMPGLHNVELFA